MAERWAALPSGPHPPTRRISSLIGPSATALACHWPGRPVLRPSALVRGGQLAGTGGCGRLSPAGAQGGARAVPAAAGDTGAVRAAAALWR